MTHHLRAHLVSRRRGLASLAMLATLGTSLLLGGCGTRDAAPESTFVLIDGAKTTTTELKGKVMLVNFWATTCVSCVKEMPMLVDTHNKFKERGYETVAVAMSYDPPNWVLNFAQSRQLPFKVALDNTGEIAKAWGDVKLTPTTYLVDKQGNVVSRHAPTTKPEALKREIEALL
jgi:peroxiredoxin